MAAKVLSFLEINPDALRIPLKTSVNAITGTASTQVELPVSPGRNGLQPALSLAYSSGAGNSAFGMGWGLQGIPVIGLSLKDGYPQYRDTDKYSFGGQELIPWLQKVDGHWQERADSNDEHFIYYFRSTQDASFTRFEKWVHKITRQVHWRAHSYDNKVLVFGHHPDGVSRICSSRNPDMIFQWLLEAQYDNNGNAIEYEYAAENFSNINGNASFEWNRVHKGEGSAQKYVKLIRYGNTTPVFPNERSPALQHWLFELVFDYGEHEEHGEPRIPAYTISPGGWPVREDPFSSYIAGFEQRTYRLCRRIMMFHHMEELGEGPTLVASTDLVHQPDPAGTTLTEIRYTAYRRQDTHYSFKSFPPATFLYTSPEVEGNFHPAPAISNDNFPVGLNGIYKWVDLYGEGLPGVLYESNDAWYYKPNLGNGQLGKQHKVAAKPSAAFGSYALSDFDGDGNLNIVVMQGRESGFYEYDRDREVWNGFKPFQSAPHVRQMDVNTQLIDLTGDGRADIVTIEQDRIIWYPSRGKEGFGDPVQISKPVSNGVSRTPTIGSNPALEYFFADMNGSGLPDQVRISNGYVEYWPNLGNGKFGAGIIMENAPQLDFDFELDVSRIRLVDIDGSGTADLIYIGRGEIRYWVNAQGNRFMEGRAIGGLPYIDNVSSAQIIDFLGDGTLCLVWSSFLSVHADSPVHYLRLTSGIKPRLLECVQNNLGLESRFHYGHSAQHYLRDKNNGTHWITKLPSHRVVVDRLENIDHIGHTRFQQRYAYHDGFFDGEERAFRGFCLVDQYDSDAYLGTSGIPETEFTDPVCLRTWYHQGAPGWQKRRARNYYIHDTYGVQLVDFHIEDVAELGPDEFFDAVRTLAGQVIRTETYGLNNEGARNLHPFEITHASYTIRRTQPRTKKSDPGFTVFQKESLQITLEENPGDPRIVHNFNLETNSYGIPVKQAAITYPRLHTEAMAEQQVLNVLATCIEVGHYDLRDRYEAGIEWEKKTFELNDSDRSFTGVLYHHSDVKEWVDSTIPAPILFDAPFASGRQARLLQWTKNYYWNDDQSAVLPWRSAGTKVLLHHQEAACFHQSFIENTLREKYDPSYLTEGYYVFHDTHWWQPGAVINYSPAAGFYLPVRETHPAQSYAEYRYDRYSITLAETANVLTDTTGAVVARNAMSAQIDYHLLAPYRIEDVNQNVSEVLYDPFGVVILSTAYGSILSEAGVLHPIGHGRLDEYVEPSEKDFNSILANPGDYLQQCASFFYYELDTWREHRQPLRSIALAREEWVQEGDGNHRPSGPYQVSVVYTDGFGRTIQAKTLTEPGADTIRYEDGRVVVGTGGEPELFISTEPRWKVSGHVVYNNKQEPVRQFEPYFSPIVAFEDDEVLETFGESGLIEYDALGRQKRVQQADGTVNRTVTTAWATYQYDANDAVAGSPYELNIEASFAAGTPERVALQKSLLHSNTPLISHVDGMGRVFFTEEADETGRSRTNRVVLDVLGNPKQIFDARELEAFRYFRDMQGRLFHEQGIDAGTRWQFINALNQSVHTWDGRGVHQQIRYDGWGRITQKQADGALGMDHVTERFVYGEDPSITDAAQRNLFGQLVEHFDQAGVTRLYRYDLMGNVLEKDRRLLADYTTLPDWSDPRELAWMEDAPFLTTVKYDALGRMKEQHLPDGTTRRYSYLQSGALHQLRVTTSDGGLVDEQIIKASSYNARGQATEMILGNDVIQQYAYDPYTYRLKRKTCFRREATSLPARQYQNIRYTYDAVGNITHLIDTAQPNSTMLFEQPRINQYTYDAFYQLTVAEGRTHQALQRTDYAHAYDAAGFVKGAHHISADNMDLIQAYTRRYSYDLSGNMLSMIHHAGAAPGTTIRWRRDFWISASSNRSIERDDLSGIPVTNPESRFDENGNLAYLSHLRSVQWNYLNQLTRAVIIDRGGDDDAEYYVYGGDGQRVRKITQRMDNGALEITEKIYLDGCEIKRVRHGDSLILERYTSHLDDGNGRVALLHQWTTDTRARETDDITRKKIHYTLSCHLGSSNFELDEEGEIINYEEYFAFGGSAFIYGDRLRDVQIKDYRYSGKECDDATQLCYYGFRYYAPWMCRWLNPDPIGPEDGLNVYQFVHNNPVNGKDEDGLRRVPVSVYGASEFSSSFQRDFHSRAAIYNMGVISPEQQRMPDFYRGLPNEPYVIAQVSARGVISDSGLPADTVWAIYYNPNISSGSSPTEADIQLLQSLGVNYDAQTGQYYVIVESSEAAESEESEEGRNGGGEEAGGNGNTDGRARGNNQGDPNGHGRRGTGRAEGSGSGNGREREFSPVVPVGNNPDGRVPQLGSTDPNAVPDGNPNGSITGPEVVNSELPIGPANPNGSVDGSANGQPWGTPAEELAWWERVLIVVAVVVVAIIVTALTFGAALAIMGVTAATATLTQLAIAGAFAGLAAGLASDATSQLLNIAASDQLTIDDYDIGQTLFSGAVGFVTGGLTAGLGGYAAGARSALSAGTARGAQSAIATITNRIGTSAITRGLTHFGAGVAEGSGSEALRQAIFEENFDTGQILEAGLMSGVMSGTISMGLGGNRSPSPSPETSQPGGRARPLARIYGGDVRQVQVGKSSTANPNPSFDRATVRGSGSQRRLDALTAELRPEHMGPNIEGTTTTAGTRSQAQAQHNADLNGRQGNAYQSGHARDSRFGGRGVWDNTFPQWGSMNMGEYQQFGARLAQLVGSMGPSDRIFISVQPRYTSPSAMAPTQVAYFIRINGETMVRAIFSNIPGRPFARYF